MIDIHPSTSGGILSSQGIRDNDAGEDDRQAEQYNAAIDGLESLLLAMACAGVDLDAPAIAPSPSAPTTSPLPPIAAT